MLLGNYLTKLNEKNRCAIPKKFRTEIGDRAIIAKWYEGCLVMVSEESWKNLLLRLTGKTDLITLPVRDTDRFIMGSAFEVEFDSQGRFVIPKTLKDYAKLNSELVFLGLGDRVEIWNTKTWNEHESYIQDHAEEMIEKISRESNSKDADS